MWRWKYLALAAFGFIASTLSAIFFPHPLIFWSAFVVFVGGYASFLDGFKEDRFRW